MTISNDRTSLVEARSSMLANRFAERQSSNKETGFRASSQELIAGGARIDNLNEALANIKRAEALEARAKYLRERQQGLTNDLGSIGLGLVFFVPERLADSIVEVNPCLEEATGTLAGISNSITVSDGMAVFDLPRGVFTHDLESSCSFGSDTLRPERKLKIFEEGTIVGADSEYPGAVGDRTKQIAVRAFDIEKIEGYRGELWIRPSAALQPISF